MQESSEQLINVEVPLYPNYENTGKLVVFYNTNVAGEEPLAELAKDAENLQVAAKSVGFDVDTYQNLKRHEIFEKLEGYTKMDHSKCTCFAVVITTHGGEEDILWASDKDENNAFYYLNDMLNNFRSKNCPNLKEKPKLFFINACRGGAEDRVAPHTGTRGTVATGATEEDKCKILTVPVEADFLVAHASCPGYYATSEAEVGSIFIKKLCDVLKNDEFSDLFDILTNVNELTARESCNEGDIQMPSFTTQLTASLQLRQPSKSPTKPESNYQMNNAERGHCYIFSKEASADENNIEDTGKHLGFYVEKCMLSQMQEIASKYIEAKHENHDCFMCVIKTYSFEHDQLTNESGEKFLLKHFVYRFHGNECPSLHGKPKIFIVQAPYRKSKLGNGRKEAKITIPETADTLIVYSTSPEPNSQGNGTLFVETLCKHLQDYAGAGIDLMSILSMITSKMSELVGLHVPSVTSQLRKKVFLH